MNISIYSHAKNTTGDKQIPVDIFLDQIKDGKWQDIVLPIRALATKEARDEAKKKVPNVTLSGRFAERKDTSLIEHSGLIGIDIDEVDPEETKSLVCADPYTYAAFTSISGRGLCVVFKINGDKHRESFAAISEYFYEKFQLIVDPTSVNPSRARFVSFDPGVYVNTKATKFTALPKKKAEKKIPEVIYVKTDFDLIIKEIQSRNVDITGGYREWLNIGFAFADKFGESGRDYFHAVSFPSSLYNSGLCDKQYTNCLKSKKSGITIGTFYYYAKMAGITTMSTQTRLITQTALYGKKGGRTKDSVVELLNDLEGITATESADIVAQVYDNNIKLEAESPIDDVAMWLKQNYDLRRNVITRYIENRGKQLQVVQFNSIYLQAARVFEKLSFELVDRIINSDFTPEFNPIHEFFDKHQARRPKGIIKRLFDAIESDTGLSEKDFFPEYKLHFGTKWVVGLISAAYGKHSPLMLVLSGNKQNTGKTEFWRRFLPTELQAYYAESKLDAGKDDEILMTQKWIIMDDEMGGKSKNETKRLKELTSKQTFSLREPYGKNNVDLVRLAALCGTTNDNEILNDPTGNRRTIPINVLSLNHAALNAIDRIDMLMEAYWMYKEGYQWELTSDDVEVLNANTGYFEQTSPEYDLLTRHFQLPGEVDENRTPFFTSTEIKSALEKTSIQKLNPTRLGMELKRAGFERVAKKIGGMTIRGYYAYQKWKDGASSASTVASSADNLREIDFQ